MLLAADVAIITSAVVANATQTITTPNAASISYSLAAGADSAAITPVSNKPMLVIGCCTNNTGVGQMSLIRIPSTAIVWVGSESYSPAAITSGFQTSAGHHVVYMDGIHFVDIQTASADTIHVHNGAGTTRTSNVTLIW
jgi:hypothetical protein